MNALTLRAQIDLAQRKIILRRLRTARIAARLKCRLTQGLSSPKALALAAAFGVALEQTRHHKVRSLLSLVNVLTSGTSLVLALLSRVGPADGPARAG